MEQRDDMIEHEWRDVVVPRCWQVPCMMNVVVCEEEGRVTTEWMDSVPTTTSRQDASDQALKYLSMFRRAPFTNP